MKSSLFILGLCAALAPALSGAAESVKDAGPPKAERRPVSDPLHGVKITDEYRWLEDSASAEVTRWTEGQDRATRALLDRSPALPPLRARIREFVDALSPSYYDLSQRGATLFARKWAPPKEQPLLV